MATAKYTETLESFARQPVTLLRLTVTGTITGSQVFRFSNKQSELIHIQIGEDVRPYLLSFRGRPTKIRPEQAVTERSRVSVTLVDDPNPPDFDSSVFNITTGGTFWKRLLLAQPDFIGSKFELLRGFVKAGFLESDFEVIFSGRLEDYQFQNDSTITLIAKDALVLINKETPSQIVEDNLVATTILKSAVAFDVDDASQITSPTEFGSRDGLPLVLRIRPGDIKEEDIIVSDIIGNTIIVGGNTLERSEEFDNAAWVKDLGITVLANSDISPFGGVFNADRIEFPSTGTQIEQDRPGSTNVTSQTWVFSIWFKADSSGTITIEFEETSAAGNTFTNTVSVTTDWQRFEVSGTFNASAGTDPRVRIKRLVGDLDHVIAFGAQFEERSTRSFYVAATNQGPSGGKAAGRGAFGTNDVKHNIGDSFIEVVAYRHQLDESGINPVIIIRDLFSRAGFADSDVDLSIFNAEFNTDSSSAFRRGRATGFVDSTIVDPQGINSLAKEVREQSGIDIWISETGLLRAKSPLTILPGDSIKILTDENSIINDSLNIQGNTDSRATRLLVYFNLKTDASGSEPNDFLNVRINVNLGIETLSGPKSRRIFSKWIFRSDEAEAIAGTLVSRYGRGLRTSKVNFDLKDDLEVEVGSIVVLNSEEVLIANTSGGVERANTFWQVVQKVNDREGGLIKIDLVLISDKHICFISPTSPPFPSDFDDASTAQKIFGFIGSSGTNKLGENAEEGCVIAP